MNKDAYRQVVVQAAHEGGTWKALRTISSPGNQQSNRIRLSPDIKRVIADMSAGEIKRRAAQEALLSSEEPDNTNDVAAQSTTEVTQQSAATQMATRIRATSPAQRKQQAAKKKKKKKKSSSEDFDALLAEFTEKDAQQLPKSPLRSSPNTNDQTITLDPEKDFLATDFLTQIKLAEDKCVACKKIVCKNRYHSTRSGTVTHPTQERDLKFTKLLSSGSISLHDPQDAWKFIARPHGDSWELTFNLGYERRNTILAQLNTPSNNDSPTEKEDSLEDYENNDRYESDEEPTEDDVTKGTKSIIARLTASRANSVVLNRERKTSAKWVDSDAQKVIEYSKNGRVMFYIDVETETVIAP